MYQIKPISTAATTKVTTAVSANTPMKGSDHARMKA